MYNIAFPVSINLTQFRTYIGSKYVLTKQHQVLDNWYSNVLLSKALFNQTQQNCHTLGCDWQQDWEKLLEIQYPSHKVVVHMIWSQHHGPPLYVF